MKFRNYRGDTVEAPEDFKKVLFSHGNGSIVWSVKKGIHRVRYCLQSRDFRDSIEAAHNVGECLHHAIECEGVAL